MSKKEYAAALKNAGLGPDATEEEMARALQEELAPRSRAYYRHQAAKSMDPTSKKKVTRPRRHPFLAAPPRRGPTRALARR